MRHDYIPIILEDVKSIFFSFSWYMEWLYIKWFYTARITWKNSTTAFWKNLRENSIIKREIYQKTHGIYDAWLCPLLSISLICLFTIVFMSLAIFFPFFLSFFFLPNSYLISSLLTYLIMTKMERRKVVAHNKILDPASISQSEGIRDFRFVAIIKTEKTHFFCIHQSPTRVGVWIQRTLCNL